MHRWLLRGFNILLFILVLYLHSPYRTVASPKVKIVPGLKGHVKRTWDAFAESKYGDFNPSEGRWLDINGFRDGDASFWGLLGQLKGLVMENVGGVYGIEGTPDHLQQQPDLVSFYQNIEGYVRGPWIRHQFEEWNHVDILKEVDSFSGYVSGEVGEIHIDFAEPGTPDTLNGSSVRGIRAEVTMYQPNPEVSLSYKLHGQHILESGCSILATSSDHFQGLAALPHFALTETQFNTVKNRLNRTLLKFLEGQTEWEKYAAGEDTGGFRHPDCELIVYLQQQPVNINAAGFESIDELEHELRLPTGKTGWSTPQMEMSMVVFSPNCGFVLTQPSFAKETQTVLIGKKIEVRQQLVRNHVNLLGLVVFIQLLLTIRQMKDINTPSMRDRISYYTISTMLVFDGQIYIALCCMSTLADTSVTMWLAVSYIAAVGSMTFTSEFLRSINEVQCQTNTAQQRALEPNDPSSQTNSVAIPIITAAGVDSIPLAVTSRPMQPSITAATPIGTGDLHFEDTQPTSFDTTRQNSQTVSVFVVFCMILLFCLDLWALTWQRSNRQIYMDVICFSYLSFWAPQIYRNIMRNCRKALNWTFVIGQTTVRLGLVLYIYAYDHNALFLRPNYRKAGLFATWISIQIAILKIQETFGPRLLIRSSWVPPAYDYHPTLREGDEMSQTYLHASPESSSKTRCLFDCAICMQSVEVPILPKVAWSASEGLSMNRSYMITPCKHVFHTDCLEVAMRYRLQCPVCRESLPPL